MKEQGDLFSSCVPVSVEHSDKGKDSDKNVDAYHIRTGRPVESEQSIGLFTQRGEIDIDFRVSGLPHAVVKQAENIRVRELVKMYQKEFCVIRNSQLAGPRRTASRWTSWYRKPTPTAQPLRSMRDFRRTRYISLNKSGRNAPMKLRSDFREAVTIMNSLHRESGEKRLEPIPFYQYQRWHSSSSSSNTSWWQWNEN